MGTQAVLGRGDRRRKPADRVDCGVEAGGAAAGRPCTRTGRLQERTDLSPRPAQTRLPACFSVTLSLGGMGGARGKMQHAFLRYLPHGVVVRMTFMTNLQAVCQL